jgi:hypothetical protein
MSEEFCSSWPRSFISRFHSSSSSVFSIFLHNNLSATRKPFTKALPNYQSKTSTIMAVITLVPSNPPKNATAATSAKTTTSTAAATLTEIYYPPASSQFALPVSAIIGIVVAGVGFLVLLAIIAAFTVCFLDRKKESKIEKEERKRIEQEAKVGTATESSSVAGEMETAGENADGNGNTAATATTDGTQTLIGARYAQMIGVNTSPPSSNPNTIQSPFAAAKGKQKERPKTIVHLPVHVSDLGSPRQSQVHYEREDPGDEERDERGFRRGASWWHPEL